MSTRRLLFVASVVVIGVILAPSVASGIDCEPIPAEREDLELLAEQREIDVDEAVERYGWHGCFSEIATSLSQRYPDDYAGAAIVDEGRRAWIAFRREVPAAVEFIGHRGFSEAELDEKLRAVHGQVAAHPDVVASSGSYDVETGRMTILAQPVDEVEDREDRHGSSMSCSRSRLLTSQ